MYRVYFLVFLSSTVFLLWGCSSFNKTNRYPAMDAGVIDNRTGEVILFYKEGDKIVIKQCKDGTVLRTRSDCAVKSGKKVRRVPVSEFKDSLKMVLRLSGGGNYNLDMKKKIDLYKKGQKRDDTKGLLRIQAELNREISDVESFISEFGSVSENTPIRQRLSGLKRSLSEVEGELGEFAELNQIIKEINERVDNLVDNVISSRDLNRYVFSEQRTGFIFNILRSYLGTYMLSASFQRISVDREGFKMGSPPEEEMRFPNED